MPALPAIAVDSPTSSTGQGLASASCCALSVLVGDCRAILRSLPSESVQCCVTSPPYWGLRDYGHANQIGQEATPELFVQTMVEVFREVRRVLKADGTCWLNLGDSYAAGKSGRTDDGTDSQTSTLGPNRCGLPNNSGAGNVIARKAPQGYKPKDLVGIPWMTALALRADGWYLRQDIIWAKPNPMPESVTDRCTKSHEYIFLLTKSDRYYFDSEAMSEPAIHAGHVVKNKGGKNSEMGKFGATRTGFLREEGVTVKDRRNRRSVWTVNTRSYKGAHFATYPPDLIKPCILAGTKAGDMVLDPFGGSGTTGQVALELGRKATLIELNPDYAKIIDQRTAITPGLALD
jgi:DNA modification methylase